MAYQQEGAAARVLAERSPRFHSNHADGAGQEALLRTLFDHAPLAQAIASAEGTIERVNLAFTALLGYSPGELHGTSIMAITHPEDVPKSWSSRQRIGAGLPRVSFQKRYLHKNGREVPALVTLSAIELDGRRTILAQIVDLTPIKQAHSDAQQAHDRLQTALAAASAGTWEVDVATGHMDWDESMRRRVGVPDHDPTPSLDAWLAAVHEDDRRSLAAALRNATMPGHGRFDHDYRLQCWDGVERWYRSVGQVQRDERTGALRAHGIAIDVTRAKQAQLDRERMHSALHRAEGRLATIVATTRDAIISTGTDLTITTWNRAAETLFGYDEAEAIGMPVIKLIAPERMHRLDARVAVLQAGQTLTSIESVFLRKDGTRIDVEITMSPVIGTDGKPAWYSAIVRDMTERKVAERRLLESQQQLEEIAHNGAHVLWTADPKNGRLLYVSPGYERVFGRSCESLYADPRSWTRSVHPDDIPAIEVARRAYDEGKEFAASYRVLRADGAVREVVDRGYPVRDASGAVMHYVGIVVDVTAGNGEPKGPSPR
jgi:PAS domain S-box-containing protein